MESLRTLDEVAQGSNTNRKHISKNQRGLAFELQLKLLMLLHLLVSLATSLEVCEYVLAVLAPSL